MNNENDSVEVVVLIQGKRTIRGVEYNLYCQRDIKADAEAIRDDLIQQGCKASISKVGGGFAVWWAK